MPVELLSVMFSTDKALEAIGYKALEDPFQPAGGGKQQQTVNPFGPAAARRKSDAGAPDQPVADVQVSTTPSGTSRLGIRQGASPTRFSE
ncbi:hypothetical protein DIPPA_19621 [Diplonema papillatum]|nr:hypothetical protein DIPPA_19621 [Diplonema papillatum]